MKKKLASILLVTTLTISLLAGCGGSKSFLRQQVFPGSGETKDVSELVIGEIDVFCCK